ncbi:MULTISPECIES: hypothetical protein [Enterobacterales]|uniref:hypothetical protein n=1 Tax=Enterobacterales TaxID=91347 RepID=UPI0013F178A1|nr:MULTISPECIES: hypothetical protein [Enterobacterales]
MSNVERLLTRLTVGRSWPGAETQSWGVNLIYTLTWRQSAHWHRVRLGPLSALSDA